MKTLTYTGYICLHSDGEADDILFLSDMEEPLAKELRWDFSGKKASVRYWIADHKATKNELKEETLKALVGDLNANYGHRYSDYTGYLWTDEDLNIGDHDLLSDIKSYKGKYIHLEIDIL